MQVLVALVGAEMQYVVRIAPSMGLGGEDAARSGPFPEKYLRNLT